MYIGGMHVTPRPTKEPSRMLEPPGTIRTPASGPICLSGYVDLSKNGKLPPPVISTIPPMRKPRRIPFFTQLFTRQPDGCDGSGSAARTAPEFRSRRNEEKTARCSSVYFEGG